MCADCNFFDLEHRQCWMSWWLSAPHAHFVPNGSMFMCSVYWSRFSSSQSIIAAAARFLLLFVRVLCIIYRVRVKWFGPQRISQQHSECKHRGRVDGLGAALSAERVDRVTASGINSLIYTTYGTVVSNVGCNDKMTTHLHHLHRQLEIELSSSCIYARCTTRCYAV